MNKLYIKQSPLLRKEIDQMQEIAMTSTSQEVSNDTVKLTKRPVEAPIFEVEDKYKKLLSSLTEESVDNLKFVTYGASFSKDSFIRPHRMIDTDETIKYVVITKVKDSDDLVEGILRIYSDDGYVGTVELDKGSTICFSSKSKFEISRVREGSSLLFFSLVYEK